MTKYGGEIEDRIEETQEMPTRLAQRGPQCGRSGFHWAGARDLHNRIGWNSPASVAVSSCFQDVGNREVSFHTHETSSVSFIISITLPPQPICLRGTSLNDYETLVKPALTLAELLFWVRGTRTAKSSSEVLNASHIKINSTTTVIVHNHVIQTSRWGKSQANKGQDICIRKKIYTCSIFRWKSNLVLLNTILHNQTVFTHSPHWKEHPMIQVFLYKLWHGHSWSWPLSKVANARAHGRT